MSKNKKMTKQLIIKRVMAGILCALMLFGTFASLIGVFGGDHSDHDHSSESTVQTH